MHVLTAKSFVDKSLIFPVIESYLSVVVNAHPNYFRVRSRSQIEGKFVRKEQIEIIKTISLYCNIFTGI